MDEKIIYDYIAKKIKKIRADSGKTQDSLASVLGVSRASIANYESNRQSISVSDLYKLAGFFGVEISEILPPVDSIIEKSSPQSLIEKALDLEENEKEELKSFIEKVS